MGLTSPRGCYLAKAINQGVTVHPKVLFDAVQLGHLQSIRATTHLAVANLRSCLDRLGPASVDGRNVAGFAVITRIWGDRPTDVATAVSGLVNRRGQPRSITAALPCKHSAHSRVVMGSTVSG